MKKIDLMGFFFVVVGLPAAAQTSPTLTAAPPNPLFVQSLNTPHPQSSTLTVTATHSLGVIPNPVDLSHLANQPASRTEAITELPSSYDLRSTGRVTAVRDQGSCGSCWAFATYGSMESILEPASTYDFSENNLKNLHGFDLAPCSGGNGFMSIAYLSRWSGPVDEAQDPYKPNTAATSPAGLPIEKHVQDVIFIPGRGAALSNDSLKNAVMTYGGVETLMLWTDPAYNSTTASYYYNGSGEPNHAVTLVGWDDNYSSKNFAKVPAGNGAFLIKNSWGTSFGQSGYFWISYYDTVYAFNETSFAYSGDNLITTYSRQYGYDPLGWISSYGYNNTTASFANVFTAVATEPLQAVSFYVPGNNASYVVNVYTGVTSGPTSGKLAATVSGTENFAGYHTIVIPQAVTVTNGTKFSVAVTLTTPGYPYPVAVELAEPGYSSAAVASPGQSYVSPDGKSWQDLTTWQSSANVCLKALTGAASNSPMFTLTPSVMTATIAPGSSYTITLATAAENGFKSAVALSAIGMPTGVSASFAPTSIASPGTGSSTLTLATTSATAPGSYTLTVTAAGAGVTKAQPITLTVSLPPSLTLTTAATTASVLPGSTTSVKLSTAGANGFQAPVALSVSGLPTGVTANFTPASIATPGSGSSTLTITATPAATPGSYSLTLTATGAGLTKTQPISLTVLVPPSFTLTSAATTASIVRGSSTTIKLTTAALNGFQSAVALSLSGLPMGVTASFAPGTIVSPGNGTSTLTISSTSTAAFGSVTLTVSASGGGVTKTQPISLTVSLPPGFTLTTAATAVTVARGGSNTIKLSTAAANGFQSAVALSLTGLPAGVTASFSPSSIATPGTGNSTLTLTASSSATSGDCILTLNASGGGLLKTQPINLTIPTSATH